MGDEISNSEFQEKDYAAFRERLTEETRELQAMFSQQQFSSQHHVAGFELEAWLVDRAFQPAAVNQQFLQLFANPLASPELASFNVEVNSTPRQIAGSVFRDMLDELNNTWQRCRATAEALGGDIIMTGILPTVSDEDLVPENMSAMERYRALNREVLSMRHGRPLVLDINGNEHLHVTHEDVMLESAATSFQIHLQVEQSRAVEYYNAAMALSGPMVALSANSPYLFGKDLWDETRIPLFEQAVAVGGYDGAAFGPIRRVTFGSDYVRESLFECFRENLEHYPIMLPVELDSSEHTLPHLRLHNGTIWRWNRPLLGFDDDGKAHLRIEHRVVPAGPTTLDAIANAAFFYGVITALVDETGNIADCLPYTRARDNFYNAARYGLRASQGWTNGESTVRELILKHLLPMAERGLRLLEIDHDDSDDLLGIIQARVDNQQNGAAWQRQFVKQHGRDWQALTESYMHLQNSGRAVHEWSV